MDEPKERKQFDSSLGGNENLPQEVYVLKFAAARSKEIAAMTECILNPCHSKLVFQTLPVHMRRRIMSHNSKRLPRKLRNAHNAQLQKSGLPSQQKRPSRKYRRRPRNLLEEYSRRQKEFIWLETHIWHAKRFHMTRKWGYKLPEAPCDKAFRACYRAGSKHCLLQDRSYIASVQLYGNMDELLSGFRRITNPKCGLGLTSQAYFNGKKEGSAYIFDIDQYPYHCVGTVDFIWKFSSEAKKCVWIFIHPSFYKNFVNILIKCFDLVLQESKSSLTDDPSEYELKPPKRRKIHNEKSESSVVKENSFYKNDKSVELLDLKDTINRFRLTGPLSHAILNAALYPLEMKTEINSKNNFTWFDDLCNNDTNNIVKTHNAQSDFWKKFKCLSSPAELPCRLVVGLNVKDPRINFPSKRTKSTPMGSEILKAEDYIKMPNELSYSPLWEPKIRKNVTNKIITTLELNKLREENVLVPGCSNSLLDNISGVPVLLIQRPGSQNSLYKRIGYNSGWDIIIPGAYGMAFWLSFILRGARTGGLRETNKLAFESGGSDLQPDTPACQTEDLECANVLREKYFRLPPNKRANFLKLSINSPFLCQWKVLLNDWKHGAVKIDNFYVLREKSVLKSLQEMIKIRKPDPAFDWNSNCLVPVRLQTKAKGRLSNFAVICIPNKDDNVMKKSSDLVEPLKNDGNQKTRHDLRVEHQKVLKRLCRKRVRSKKKLLENSTKYTEVPKQNNTALIEAYAAEMKELWLPRSVENVRRQCTREVMGYVTHGDFSFTEARSVGVGYVTLTSILYFIQNSNQKGLVLTRNPTSRQYRYAEMEVICL